MSCARLRIHGRVQGVGYRAWLQREASTRGLSGWVRNRPDGTVEALLCGEKTMLDAIVAACAKGPWLAAVTRIERRNEEGSVFEGRRSGFRELPTSDEPI